MRKPGNRRSDNAELSRLAQKVAELEKAVAGLQQANGEWEAMVQINSHLLSNLSHELRALLATIRGYTKMVLEEKAGQINSTQREYLAIVSENTDRLVGVVSNSLQFITDQQVRLRCFDMRELWQVCFRSIELQALERSIRITETIPTEPFVVTGDQEKLAMVFDGLLANAIKFTGGGGEIGVKFSHGRDGEVKVEVSDTGVGIAPELLDRIFNHYYRATIASSNHRGPVGVGLPTVRDIVWLHGGRIAVTSKLGEGSTFIFTLPAIQAGQQEAPFQL